MASTAYVIWERSTRTAVGGPSPQVFVSSALAQLFIDDLVRQQSGADRPGLAKTHDVVAVQVA